MGVQLREKDFKLGCFHGKVEPQNTDSEAKIQRVIALTQRIVVEKTKKKSTIIRLFGYEVPLEKDKSRGHCIDLLGYDKDCNLYIIELKKEDSREKISKVIEQLNNYANKVKEIKSHIEKEFEKEFFYSIKFNKIEKRLLAPKKFYDGKETSTDGDSIEFWYFGRCKDICKKKIDGSPIRVAVKRR